LLPGAQQSGNVTFDVHTLVYAALAMIVGFQAVVFALFTKTFGITEGLLPPDPRLDRLYRHVTLETGLVVGSLVSLAGLAGSFYAVGLWQARAFGPLEQTALTLRVVIVSGTAIALGIETVLASFFLSVLGLRRR
jgi:hypothetical protein